MKHASFPPERYEAERFCAAGKDPSPHIFRFCEIDHPSRLSLLFLLLDV